MSAIFKSPVAIVIFVLIGGLLVIIGIAMFVRRLRKHQYAKSRLYKRLDPDHEDPPRHRDRHS